MKIRDYYRIAKPGIVYGNLFVAVGAFLMGAHWQINLESLGALILGLGLVIASGGVANNYFDRDIDKVMARTKKRASVTGIIPAHILLWYSVLLGLSGMSILYFFVNKQAFATALIGWLVYVIIYTLLTKRWSEWGTLIGSISGAVPPLVGYVAATGQFDYAALVVFLMLVFWQMPHAYAIALFRFDDYAAALVPVLPVARGIRRTKIEIVAYVILFLGVAPLLTFVGATGSLYGLLATLASLSWLILGIIGFYTEDWKRWGRRMFFASLIILMLLFFVMAVDSTTIALGA